MTGEGPFTTVYLPHPLTEAARDRVEEQLSEDAQRLGSVIAVEGGGEPAAEEEGSDYRQRILAAGRSELLGGTDRRGEEEPRYTLSPTEISLPGSNMRKTVPLHIPPYVAFGCPCSNIQSPSTPSRRQKVGRCTRAATTKVPISSFRGAGRGPPVSRRPTQIHVVGWSRSGCHHCVIHPPV